MLESKKTIFSDHVLYFFLIASTSSTKILDLGSFFGMTPFLVEDIARLINYKSDSLCWTCVDNNTYVKQLKAAILENKPTDFFREWQIKQWKKMGLIPETTAEEFHTFWENLCKKRNIKQPNIISKESLENDYTKFDIIIFDLNAGNYNDNYKIFLKLIKENIHPDTILIFDDVQPKHPNQMALFHRILKEFNYEPLAFSLSKIAIVSKKSKEKIIKVINESKFYDIDSSVSFRNWRKDISKRAWFHLEYDENLDRTEYGNFFYVSPRFFYLPSEKESVWIE
jgi:SAM-dependent methyltransferase